MKKIKNKYDKLMKKHRPKVTLLIVVGMFLIAYHIMETNGLMMHIENPNDEINDRCESDCDKLNKEPFALKIMLFDAECWCKEANESVRIW